MPNENDRQAQEGQLNSLKLSLKKLKGLDVIGSEGEKRKFLVVITEKDIDGACHFEQKSPSQIKSEIFSGTVDIQKLALFNEADNKFIVSLG